MKSAIALLAALVGLAGLVALGCTAPLAGAPCGCLPGYECDEAADVCRPIGIDASSLAPADADLIPSDASGNPSDADLSADSGGGSWDATTADAGDGFTDGDLFTPDADVFGDAS